MGIFNGPPKNCRFPPGHAVPDDDRLQIGLYGESFDEILITARRCDDLPGPAVGGVQRPGLSNVLAIGIGAEKARR